MQAKMERDGVTAAAAVLMTMAMLGCRSDPPTGAPAVERSRPVESTRLEPAPVEPIAEPPTRVEPEPVASPTVPEAAANEDAVRVQVAEQTVEAWQAVRDPATDDAPVEVTSWVRVSGAREGADRIGIDSTFEFCDGVEVSLEPVQGVDSPLVLVQTFCEQGADEFSREIRAAVVHVGDRSVAPRIVWEGEGTYSNSFGLCEHIDVPVAKVPRAGVLVVYRWREVVPHDDPDGLGREPCRARKARRTGKVEIPF